jgi:hypothetical protein
MSAPRPAIPPDEAVRRLASGPLPPKRNRTQLSCTHCRHAKLKCDRKSPCSFCIKRGRAEQCTFLPPTSRKKPAESMQNRLRHLEGLLKDVMTSQPPTNHSGPDYAQVTGMGNGNAADVEAYSGGQVPSQRLNPAAQPPTTTTNATSPTSSGQVVQGTKETTYVGATHWAAILDDVTRSHLLEPLTLADDSRLKRSKTISMDRNRRVMMLMTTEGLIRLFFLISSHTQPRKGF